MGSAAYGPSEDQESKYEAGQIPHNLEKIGPHSTVSNCIPIDRPVRFILNNLLLTRLESSASSEHSERGVQQPPEILAPSSERQHFF